ncbi:ATP-binding protein [Streptomyces sp. NPDC059850]|uniref:ATP-binding protein n=1 Tax=Streptomyces sp. NPDC059850 TaxID=3346970 RepID=UPI003663CED7
MHDVCEPEALVGAAVMCANIHPHSFHASLIADISLASDVRKVVTRWLERWNRPEILDAAVLAVDELFSNAVKHGSQGDQDRVEVTGMCRDTDVRIAVADSSPCLPVTRKASVDQESGRGLALVAAVSDSWGIELSADVLPGKRVWFTVPLSGLGRSANVDFVKTARQALDSRADDSEGPTA